MGSFLRSEEMRFCQLIVEKDAAFNIVAEIGKQPYVQFKDLNPNVNNFQRTFVKDIRRFDEMERKLRFLENQIVKDQIVVAGRVDNGDYTILPTSEVNTLEGTLSELEKDVKSMNSSDAQLKANFMDLKEWDAVLDKTDEFFQGGVDDQAQEELENLDEEGAIRVDKGPVNYLVGIISRQRLNTFERVLWRACHHTAYIRSSDIEEELEESNGEKVHKSVFIVFLKGDRMRSIVEKVCDGFKAKLFKNCPKTFKERQSARNDVRARIQDLETVLGQTREHRFRVLQAAANNHNLWLKQVRMIKTVYHMLNLFTFDGIGRFFVGECWIPLKHIDDVNNAIQAGAVRSGSSVKPVLNILETSVVPPTYNETNKFTAVFQGIVDSYGIASYRELNPAPYTIITFPFLFSCMFGDLGHGCIMLMAGLWFVLREKNLIARNIKDEIFSMFFGGRYIILLMGIFSIHAGIVYNDMFAKSFNIFGSGWKNPYNMTELDGWIQHTPDGKEMLVELAPEMAYDHAGGPYSFGVDPIWNIAENKLNFLNSMKMKLSVILGITQMTFGVIISFFNHSFNKSKIDIFTVFIPQMLFMACIFIYLCIQIILKWLFFWTKEATIFGMVYPGSHCAPSLLIGLINMFMMKDRNVGFVQDGGKVNGEYREQESCYLSQWYPGQGTIEMVLVIVAVICIPIMLFGKPIHHMMQEKKKKKALHGNVTVRANVVSDSSEIVINGGSKKEEASGHGGDHGVHGEEALGDVIVHQAIHTIEYVLGCVSHTASYLRLWALSLAHAQLSEVLWHMVFVTGGLGVDGTVGFIAVYVVFFIFFVLTVSILVLMEGLSAFLHALRLHWVEFQSKFYLGLGYPFVPYSFKTALQEAEANASTASA
uniref:V-type proton ATPase subunit a n=1 Tax=Caenorhabditis japonica TaxID=281687 RepID=A0A8R1I515_CAEJA